MSIGGNGGDHRAEIEELRRQLSAKDALLAARTAELAAAKTGLVAKTLEAEKLKAQLAKLRRLKLGASSERIEREIEQFELALEEVEAATAEITAPTAAMNEAEAPDAHQLQVARPRPTRRSAAGCRLGCRATTSCGGRELPRACRHGQVLRPSPALPTGRDLCPQRRRCSRAAPRPSGDEQPNRADRGHAA